VDGQEVFWGRFIIRTAYGICILLVLLLVTVPASAGVNRPAVRFTANDTSGQAPLPVQFTDVSTGIVDGRAWFFGDEQYRDPWIKQNASSGWKKRALHSTVVLRDGSIVLTGGGMTNETWRSTDNGAHWTLMNASSGWPARDRLCSVTMPNGAVLLMGGYDTHGTYFNDTWLSVGFGERWIQMNASSGWMPRAGQSCVGLADGSVLLTGGYIPTLGQKNDTWRSTDYGAHWTLLNASSGWSRRESHSSVVLPDTSIVLMGGYDLSGYRNDTWRSADNGTHWVQMNASSGWLPRGYFSSVAMPDQSVLVMGGLYNIGDVHYRDVWRSTNRGASWVRVNASAGWAARSGHTSVALRDGSVLVMGGSTGSYLNDTWRFAPAASADVAPVHVYAEPGEYKPSLQVYNAGGVNRTRISGYILVAPSPAMKRVGVFHPATHTFTLKNGTKTTTFVWGAGTDLPVAGDWNNDDMGDVGVYRPSTQQFILKNGSDTTTVAWGIAGDLPVAGDWNGDGLSNVGVFRPLAQKFVLKNGTKTTNVPWGVAADLPVAGDWNGDGLWDVGVFRNSTHTFILKNGTEKTKIIWGTGTDLPVSGDWNGDGLWDVGVYRQSSHNFILKTSLGTEKIPLGQSTDLPVVAKWS
jgi:hypothetical protein